jgi:hypothetical protein
MKALNLLYKDASVMGAIGNVGKAIKGVGSAIMETPFMRKTTDKIMGIQNPWIAKPRDLFIKYRKPIGYMGAGAVGALGLHSLLSGNDS